MSHLPGEIAASIPCTRPESRGHMTRQEYRRFLYSPYWRAVRRRVITAFPQCEDCGCHNNLNVHHTSYECLGTEAEYYGLKNLVTLCRSCHAKEHRLPGLERDWSGPEHIRTIVFRAVDAWGFTYTTKRPAA